MANGNGGWQARVVIVAAALAIAGVGGAIRTAIAQSVTETRVENLEKQQLKQERLTNETLKAINNKLGNIQTSINDSNVEAAKSHHQHNPR